MISVTIKLRNSLMAIFTSAIIIMPSCEEVIEIDLNSAYPAFVTEAVLFRDSVASVRLTRTTNYFNTTAPYFIADAQIRLWDGEYSEELSYSGNGYYRGENIKGAERRVYEIEIIHEESVHRGYSRMPDFTGIESVKVFRDNTPGILNPSGETVFTINCTFIDNPHSDSYYMVRFVSEGRLVRNTNYYLLTGKSSNHGSFTNSGDTISFSESFFYNDREIEVQVELYSIDKGVYDYFRQLDGILFWSRRVLPPTPYNPSSNLNGGTLGYFAAWTYDFRTVVLDFD